MRRSPAARSLAGLLAAVLGLAGCAAARPDVAPTDGGPLVAFYGDSYTAGTALADSADRWSTLLCRDRGWREYNPSVNGLGFVNNRTVFGDGDLPDLIVASDPDIVVVTMGLNDNFSYDRAGRRIRDAIDDDLRRLREGLPDARIVVVEPFWYTADRPASVEVIAGWVREAAARIGADWIGGASRWLDGHYADDTDTWMAADGLHPDEVGHAEMAARMDAALRELDPPL